MKLRKFLFIASIILLPLLYGCPDKKAVTTTINRDGSCVRTVGEFDPRDFKGIDSVKQNISIPVDQSWTLVNINDTVAVLRKEYNSVAELDELYANDESALNIYDRNVELVKKFRWFHTTLQYRETYKGALTEIPLTNYMTKDEAELFKMPDNNDLPLIQNMESKAKESLLDNIEERFEFWLFDNIYMMGFNDVIEISDSLKLSNTSNIDLIAVRDSVKKIIDKEAKKIISFNSDDELKIDELAGIIGEQLELDSIAKDVLIEHVIRAELDEKYENEILVGFTDDYHNLVIMPGQLTDTNAESLNSDTLAWDVNPIKFIDSDYVMFAESKVANDWAYLVSGFILAIALLIPFLKRRKV